MNKYDYEDDYSHFEDVGVLKCASCSAEFIGIEGRTLCRICNLRITPDPEPKTNPWKWIAILFGFLLIVSARIALQS